METGRRGLLFPDTSRLLLAELTRDSSTPNAELARRLNLSRPTVIRHLKLLESRVVSHFAAIVDHIKLNSRIFFLEIKTNPEEPEVIDAFREIPQVRSIDGIIGEFSLWIKVVARDQGEFNRVLNCIDRALGETTFQRYHVIEVLVPFKEYGEVLGEDTTPLEPVDDLSWQLVNILVKYHDRRYARAVTSRLASGPTPPPPSKVSRKLRELVERRVIRRFTTSIRPDYAVEATKFLLRVKPKNLSHYELLARQAVRDPHITCLYRTGEDYGLLAVVRVEGNAAYRKFITGLYATGEVLDTHTTLVLEEVEPALVPYSVAL
ncbi:MAG: Lrp/AsnC family transcriptional regulator [Promethearchaeota archaeon]